MARILVIDDSLVARMGVKSCIPKEAGHEVVEAADGTRGLEAFLRVRPDVTFLDLTMPDKNGLEVLKEMRAQDPTAVVIILSADLQKKTLDQVMAEGAFSMMKKPPVKALIQEQLARALDRVGVAS